MITIYAEKPDMAAKIAKALNLSYTKHDGFYSLAYEGTEYCVTWGFGHMCQLFDTYDYSPELKKWQFSTYPVIPNPFYIKLKPQKNVRRQFDIIKDLFAKSSMVINAVDADQEGELIFYYLVCYLNNKTPWKRLWLHSTADSHIRQQMHNLLLPSSVTNIMLAAKARAESDWLVGINATVFYSLLSKELRTLGRVQTPTLTMVVDRELQIQKHKKSEFYTVKAEFLSTMDRVNGKYEGGLKTPAKFDSKEEAQAIQLSIIGKPAEVTDISIKNEIKRPPMLYDLGALQKEANEKFGYTAKQTGDLAQSLYEKDLVSYPRTEWRALPKEEKAHLVETISNLIQNESIKQQLDFNIGKPYFDVPKDADSHFAIIPLSSQIPDNLTDDEKNIFYTICDSAVRIFMPPAIIEKKTVTTTVCGFDFVSHGSVIKQEGWLAINMDTNEELLPPLYKGLDCLTLGVRVIQGETQPPKRYTDASLITAMRKCSSTITDKNLRELIKGNGIGRSSTRGAIIEGLVDKEYIERQGKYIVPTDKGMQLILDLNLEDIKSPEMTAKWEAKLKGIREGTYSYQSFLAEMIQYTQDICNKLRDVSSESIGICPLCNGTVRKMSWGWGCENHHTSKCGFGISKSLCGKVLNDNYVRRLLNGEKIAMQGFQSKKGNTFDAKIYLDNGSIKFEF